MDVQVVTLLRYAEKMLYAEGFFEIKEKIPIYIMIIASMKGKDYAKEVPG